MDGSANENARPRDELERAQAPQTESKPDGQKDFGTDDAEATGPRTPSFLATAELLVGAGLQLIPLDGKRPRDGRWQLKQYDSRQVAAAAEGVRNVGVRLTRDLLVIDADPRNYRDGVDSLALLAADLGLDLDAYPFVETGGGGLHVYMRKPADLETTETHERYPGIEFKTFGRQVVAPGSIHPDTGRLYVGRELALLALEVPAPASLLGLIERKARSHGDSADFGELEPEQVAAALDQLDPSDFAEHDEWLNLMMACHHASGGEARQEFIDWSTGDPRYADHSWIIGRRWDSLHEESGRGGKPITARYLHKIVQAAGGHVPNAAPEADFEAWEDDEPAPPVRADERWPFLTLEELQAMPPPRWLIEGLIQEETIAAIYGAPESGKSFLAIDLIMSVAADRPWHGRAVTQGPVLYIAAEGALGLNKRIQAWKIDRGVGDAPFRLMRSSLNLTNAKEADAFCKAMGKLGPLRMIVIDTLNQTAAGADENSAQDMGRYIDAMKKMRDASGASVVVIHHSGKDASKGMRGSTALLGAMDTTIEVVRPDDEGPVMHVRVRKQKDAEKEKPIHFEMAKLADSLVLRVTKDAVRQTDAQFVAPSLLDWIAAWVVERGSAPFKEMLEARLALTLGKSRKTRDELMQVLGEGFESGKVSSDGTRVWLEREAGKVNGALTVHAIRRGAA